MEPSRKRLGSAPVSVVPIPGKGLGVVANRHIGVGEAVLAEKPLIQLVKDFSTGADWCRTETEGTWQRTNKPADPGTQSKLLNLSTAAVGTNPIDKVINTNGFVFLHPPPKEPTRRDVPDELSGAKRRQTIVFANISRINHSCAPNATMVWHESYGWYSVARI